MHKTRINRAFADFNIFVTIRANVSYLIAKFSDNFATSVFMRVSGLYEKIKNNVL